ncbi:hypothetical protein O181_076028 [Austropuccinia psidii MF-1]|uniref:Integrase catalytic domain-containing protein n=1 Tax=Austropuccinia psidii MF-1 TaxID=1389203 RepID=A0A9Q3FA22_9BASI|nr:hypothetical protein [Austropuccinia psidii MF-1]
METLHDRSLKKVVSDRGGEFLNKKFKSLLEAQGFTHVFLPADTPQQNGFAERANWTILEKAWCILNTSNLSSSYWEEAINTSTILSNLTPTPSRKNLSPYSLWKRTPPRIKNLRVFGCRAVVSIPKHNHDWKLGPLGKEGIMLGYENDNSLNQILRLTNRNILISRHVKFDESVFPSLKQATQTQDQSAIMWGNYSSPTKMVDEAHLVRAESVDEARSAESLEVIQEEAQEEVDELLAFSNYSGVEEVETPPMNHSCIKVIGPRHPTMYSSNIDRSNILPFGQRPKVLITSASDCPRTYKKALFSADKALWEVEIKKKLQAMNNLSVWDVVDLKSDYKLVGTNWVFRIKRNHLNEIPEHKARLCAQGFTQTPGLDFDKTYSPTGRLNSLQTLIAFEASRNIEFHQVEVKSAFLNAPLTETVYLSIPQGLSLDQRKCCIRLNKAIYGLKQAPLAWYERL